MRDGADTGDARRRSGSEIDVWCSSDGTPYDPASVTATVGKLRSVDVLDGAPGECPSDVGQPLIAKSWHEFE